MEGSAQPTPHLLLGLFAVLISVRLCGFVGMHSRLALVTCLFMVFCGFLGHEGSFFWDTPDHRA
jgi:hypothetical protein